MIVFKIRNNISKILSHSKNNCVLCSTYDPVNNLWSWLFCLSKMPELGDTFFIVLRKQPLIFLHWYHHVTVLLYTWYSCIEISGYSRWFTIVNSFIHSWMYSYYALKAMGFKLPKWFAMTITILQIAQMFWGIFVTISAYYYAYIAQIQCNVLVKNLTFTTLMYLSYLMLFINFFKQTYFSDKHANKVERKGRTKTEWNTYELLLCEKKIYIYICRNLLSLDVFYKKKKKK